MHNNSTILIFFVFVVLLGSYNFYTKKYSNKVIAAFSIIALFYRIILIYDKHSMLLLLDSFISLVLSFHIMYYILGFKRGAIGAGDAKLFMCISLILGSVYTLVFSLVAYLILWQMMILYSNNKYEKITRLASGYVWVLSFSVVVVLNIYWKNLLALVF